MSKFLKCLLNVVDNNNPIPDNAWSKIIDEADQETLEYLQDEGFQSIKYFTRDDWMDRDFKEYLINKTGSRLTEIQTDQWFKRHF